MSIANHYARPALPALTALRFFAAMLVLAFHYCQLFFTGDPPGPLALGHTGLSFFFVLSGFILAYTYSDSDFSIPAVKHRYFQARIARIFPVYLLSLFLGLPFVIKMLLDTAWDPAKTLLAASLILAPMGLQAWVPGTGCVLNCPAWSVSTELFFYGLLPFLLQPILRQPRRWILAIIAAWTLVSALNVSLWTIFGQGLRLTSQAAHSQPGVSQLAEFIMNFPPFRAPEFLVGILLFTVWSRCRTPSNRMYLSLAMAAGGLLISPKRAYRTRF